MNTELETHRPATLRALKVVLAYDELSSGKLGKELCDRVVRRLGLGCELQLVPWSLSVLRIPEILQEAATVASGAAVIVVAAGLAELSVAAMSRIRRLIQHRKGSDGALAMLIHGPPEASLALSHACALLRQAAREAGMTFFWEMTQPLEREPSYYLEAALLDSIVRRTGTVEPRKNHEPNYAS
jgi:hypothetical protein